MFIQDAASIAHMTKISSGIRRNAINAANELASAVTKTESIRGAIGGSLGGGIAGGVAGALDDDAGIYDVAKDAAIGAGLGGLTGAAGKRIISAFGDSKKIRQLGKESADEVMDSDLPQFMKEAILESDAIDFREAARSLNIMNHNNGPISRSMLPLGAAVGGASAYASSK